MDLRKITCFRDAPSVRVGATNFLQKSQAKCQIDNLKEHADCAPSMDIDIDLREIYFLIMHFLSSGPLQKTVEELSKELLEHELLPRRYHASYSRSGALYGDEYVDGNSFPLNYDSLVGRYSHVGKDHLVRLLKQLILSTSPPLRSVGGRTAPSAADVPTLLGTGSFSLLSYERNSVNKKGRNVASYLRWPHMKADQFRGLSLREIGGGFSRHHRAPSIRLACYAIAKPSAMVLKMQNMKKLRGHRDAVYCAIFDRSGRYVITGSDDRLVKIWSMETAFCLASCRGHEGDITDLSVSLNNAVVASASNDFSIRVWRLPDGYPISVLRGHTGAVTAIAFSPRPSAVYQLLSSSDDGSCRVWDARYSQCHPRVYIPKPTDAATGTNVGLPSAGTSLGTALTHQILCCAFNANGTVFVTGSSDTYARVWIVSKPSTDDPEQPSHEIDILAGHENDVNYVQFSGCAVPSRSSLSDSITEDSTSKFKNSWYNHDNIVTCSRDGSAIIWIPRSRRYHGKVGRWIRAYHLKVPPPPMPPRPPRGGPRQRFLPTPRGVNMIVWSLDNRFVLAAIMDNRICVWNASDGSLVHSLSGHTASTYVLDVHPFNPRIAMSAGYDGKTILWDIWEGTPIRVYDEIVGHLKMVDGRFSPDGTSIVLSDDAGQIYLLDTGEGEPQKDAKYDQFFLGDYRPLTQDTHGNIVDQETQLAPYVRNIQDPLCDSSLHPYPEPYQSVYQQRRLGALGIEWRPSSIKFAVGMDNGQGYQLLPLADPNVVLEPLPALVDTLWEPENDVLVDDSDSEYNAAEEYYTDQSCPSDSTSIDVGSSEEDKGTRNKRDGRQLKRKKSRLEVEVVTSSGRRVKRKVLDEQEGTSSSRSKRHRRSKTGQNASQRKKSTKLKFSRPRRLGTRNVVSSFSQISETSADEDDEDEDVSAGDTSESESCLEGSHEDYSISPKISPGTSEGVKPLNRPDSNVNAGNKKKLVVRFSLHQRGAPTQSENHTGQLKSEDRSGVNFRADEESPVDDRVNFGSGDLGSSSTNVVAKEASETYKIQSGDGDAEKPTEVANELRASPIPSSLKASWGKLKIRMSHGSHQGATAPRNENATKTNAGLPNENKDNSLLSGTSHLHGRQQLDCDSGASVQQISVGAEKDSSSELRESSNLVLEARDLSKQQNNSKRKPTVLKIKTKRNPGESSSKYLGKTIADGSFGSLGESKCRKLSSVEESTALELSLADSHQDEQKDISHIPVYDDEVYYDSNPNVSLHDPERESGSPYTATDSGHRAARARSATLSIRTCNLEGNSIQSSTSRGVEKSSTKAVDYFPSKGSRHGGRSKSSRSKSESSYRGDRNSLDEGNLHESPRKQNSLLLEEQEDGYRYIPQLGDEVVYLLQGHQDYIELTQMKQPGPWRRYGDKVRAIEVCLVEDLKYGTWSGSGESCCHITLKFIDSRCPVIGQNFVLTLTELDDFPDFVVERTWYEASMERNWAMRDKCLVWWRDDIGQGGAWWEGRITAIKDKSSDFPGSPWERYLVKYKNDDTDYRRHCPWELHDPNKLWEPPTIELNTKLDIENSLAELMQTANKDKDKYGIRKLNEVAQKTDFINRFPVPLYPELIKLRVEKNYYRNLKALKHDIEVMLSNAESYFQKHVELLRKTKRLSNWFSKNIT